MQSWHRRVEALEKRQGVEGPVTPFILAETPEEAERQVRRFEAEHAGRITTLFIMCGPPVPTAAP